MHDLVSNAIIFFMKTPFGKECPYFYGDYRRGRNHEECRLLLDNHLEWNQNLCEKCPVPEIKLANACEHMELTPQFSKKIIFKKQQIEVSAYCHKSSKNVEDPRIGCGECHPLEFIIFDEPDKP